MTTILWTLLFAIVTMISWVDVKTLRIPDGFNLVLLGFGIAHAYLLESMVVWVQVVAGAVLFGLLYLLRDLHRRRSGKIGLGLGDVKMAGAAAVWISPFNIPLFMAIASGAGLLALATLRIWGKTSVGLSYRLPFGPFIGLALCAIWSMETVGMMERGL